MTSAKFSPDFARVGPVGATGASSIVSGCVADGDVGVFGEEGFGALAPQRRKIQLILMVVCKRLNC